MALSTLASAPQARPHEHLVGFYETESYLVDAVAAFLAPILRDGGVTVVIATGQHHGEFETALSALGVPVTDDNLCFLDAAATLAAIMRDGEPDPGRFHDVVGAAIEDPLRAGRPVAAFGEMVALLWEDGAWSAALALERLWGAFAETRPFALFCGYPSAAFDGDLDTQRFRDVCAAHSSVLPSESVTALTESEDRGRTAAILRQEAIASANERHVLQRKQEELEAALEQVTEADRVRRQFAAMVAHDIRNPTVVIAGILALLRDSWPELDAEQVHEYLCTAARSAAQIERLLDDIMLVARLEAGQFTYDLVPIDLGEIVDEVVRETREATGRTIELFVPERLRHAVADPGRQTQILSNLLANAIKFSDPATTVTIVVTDRGDELTVSVRDEGPGIAASDLDKLFRPFSRVGAGDDGASKRPGTGLGLFIAKALTEGQGGTVTVQSTVGVGTTFTYTVPTVTAAA